MQRTLPGFILIAAIGLAAVLSVSLRQQRADAAAADSIHSPLFASTTAMALLALQDSPDAARSARRRPAPPATSDQAAGESQPLNPHAILQCMEVANDIDPELGGQLLKKQERSPDEFNQTMQQGPVGRRLYAMAQLKERDPHLYRLKVSEVTQSLQINRVVAQVQEAMQGNDQAKIDSLNQQLRDLLQIQFAMSLYTRGEYLCRIEEQVKTLQAEIEHDAKNFHQIVDARMRDLLAQPVQTDPTAVIAAPPPDAPRR